MIGSQAAYSRHRKARGLIGATRHAVQKALASGRITAGSNGLIDFERADRDWEQNLNHRKRPAGRAHVTARVPVAAESTPTPDGKQAEDESFLEAQRQHEWVKVKKAELELQARRAELLESAELQEALGERVIAMRNRASSLPANLSQKLALESDPIAIEEMLQSEMDNLLQGFSEWRPNAA